MGRRDDRDMPDGITPPSRYTFARGAKAATKME